MKVRLALWAIVRTLAAGTPLVAHHSFDAEFDAKQAIRITGALTEIEWTNPHSYFHLSVKNDNATVEEWICEGGSPGALSRRGFKRGNVVKWTCEAGSPGALSRKGFKKSDLKLGDTLVVDGYLAKDGSHLIDARRVTLPDGRIVSGASAGDGGPGQ